MFDAYGFLALVVIFLARLRHSRMGRAFEAVKLDETAAEAMGVNVTRAKLIAIAASFVVNFSLSHFVVFRGQSSAVDERPPV